jgi:hypothetical protein
MLTSALLPAVERGALLSECGLYRYRLWRRWGPGCNVAFVMLNPSTADGEVDDPTIRRCMGLARSWGFDGIEVVNLYALRTTKPKHLLDHPDPEGPGNVGAWKAAGLMPGMRTMVAAWGAGCRLGGLPGSQAFWTVAPTGYKCLGITKGGDPRHPLSVRGDAPLVAFTHEAEE